MADHSTVHPKGVLEDVLIQVGEFIFPIDFYILDMGDLDVSDKNSIIFRRPSLKTAKTKIDLFSSMRSMEFEGDLMNFKMNDGDTTYYILLIFLVPAILYLRVVVSFLMILYKIYF